MFIINGSGGVGKDTFVSLVDYRATVINFSSVDKNQASKFLLEKTLDNQYSNVILYATPTQGKTFYEKTFFTVSVRHHRHFRFRNRFFRNAH